MAPPCRRHHPTPVPLVFFFVVFVVEFWAPFPPPGPHPPPRLVLVARGVYDAPHHPPTFRLARRTGARAPARRAPLNKKSAAQGPRPLCRSGSAPLTACIHAAAAATLPVDWPRSLVRAPLDHTRVPACRADSQSTRTPLRSAPVTPSASPFTWPRRPRGVWRPKWSPHHRAMLARRGLGNRPPRGAEEQQGRCAPRQPVGGGADVEPRRRRGLQADTPTENIRSRGRGGGAWSCERGIRERGGVTRGEGRALTGQTQPKPPADGPATRPPCKRPAPPSAATCDRDGPSRPRGRAARRRSGRRPAPPPPTGQVGGGGSGARPTVPPAAANRA